MRPNIIIATGQNSFRHGLFKQTDFSDSHPAQIVTTLERAAKQRDTVVVFDGGADVTPAIYGKANRFSQTSPMRDMREMFIYHIARQLGIPLFGFCRGHQFIAAMNGAELVQDILDDLMCYHAGGTHTVEVVNPDWDEFFKNSPFGPYTVSSTHHQCVHRDRLPVGSELLCVASDENAIVEALLYPAFGLTMQCHPEFSDWTAPIEWVADNFLA